MILPTPGAPHLVNLVATLLLNEHHETDINVGMIAKHSGLEIADLIVEFRRQEVMRLEAAE